MKLSREEINGNADRQETASAPSRRGLARSLKNPGPYFSSNRTGCKRLDKCAGRYNKAVSSPPP